jgi:acetyl-CoA acetyltransferase family protein
MARSPLLDGILAIPFTPASQYICRMNAVYLVDALRTPVGRHNGMLREVRADDLFATTLKALIARNPSVDVNQIEDVIAGDANQGGEDCRNVARLSSLLAGLPVSVGGNTVNRLCGSGMQAIIDASRGIASGDGQLYLAGGVESMSRAPQVKLKGTEQPLVDSTIGWRFTNPELKRLQYDLSMGQTADLLAQSRRISREEQDLFAHGSHQKYFKAKEEGKWEAELIPVEAVTIDESPRRAGIEALQRLRPVFNANGTVTAGNASGLNDGAAAVMLADESALKTFGLQPLARISSTAVAGVEPLLMGTGPVPATRKALQRAALDIAQIGLWEINESFAVQVLACMAELGIDPGLVNVNGGSLAIGNPLGSNGARICTTLIHEMIRRKVKYGAATTCIGVGQGSTIIFENCRL